MVSNRASFIEQVEITDSFTSTEHLEGVIALWLVILFFLKKSFCLSLSELPDDHLRVALVCGIKKRTSFDFQSSNFEHAAFARSLSLGHDRRLVRPYVISDGDH